MNLSREEMDLLGKLIGRKAERIIMPTPKDSLTKPVEIVLVLSRNRGVLIDSCYRTQRAVETPEGYPQMRVRMINKIPEYVNGHTIELSEFGGEIIASIEVTSENVLTSTEQATYTKAVHIEFTGQREVTITRETYRTPSLDVYEERREPAFNYEPNASITTTVHSF